ncbi:anti-sigma factor antagonist [Candidatus Uabimicrobium sp. HlEnr_7]|uniref:anti-sigma factor antagonist n=1 Tax=Candidatus Uabimicrobium helgolandensis TaxID=3095367 RepID=UPI003557863F
MVQYNAMKKEVSYKVVYYGPKYSGTTTNLKYIEQNSSYARGNKLTSIATERGKDLNFDFLSLNVGSIAGLKTNFQLFGVPGSEEYMPILKLILQNVDGIIFIVDSCDLDSNIQAMTKLENSLLEQNLQLNDIPLIIQWNKRDHEKALGLEVLQKQINYMGAREASASAVSGDGVFDTFEILADQLVENNYKLVSKNEQEKPSEKFTPLNKVIAPIEQTQRKVLDPSIKKILTNMKNFQIVDEIKHEMSDGGRVLLLRLKGKIDKESINFLKEKLQECYLAGDFRIVLDFKEVEHMQSTAFGMIIEIANKAKMMKGEVNLVYVRPKIKTFFEMMGVQHFLGIYDTEEQAISAFQIEGEKKETISKVNSTPTTPKEKSSQLKYKTVDENKKRIFLSHSSDDLSIAQELEEHFTDNGYNTCCYKTGGEWTKEITDVLLQSDTVVLLCSDNTDERTFFNREWAISVFLKKQVIPCFIDDEYTLPLPLQNLPSVSLRKFKKGVEQLLTIMNSIAKNRLSRKIASITPLNKSFFGKPSTDYYGNRQHLVSLYLKLLDSQKICVTPTDPQWIHGIGKTELVYQFVQNFGCVFEKGIVWINAANNMEKEFVRAAKNLNIKYDRNNIKFLMNFKMHMQEQTLLIIDNVHDFSKMTQDIVPGFSPMSCNCRTIFISSQLQIEEIENYCVPILSVEDTLTYLNGANKPTSMLDEKAVRELCNRIAYFPVAITLLCSYFKKNMNTTYKDYIQSLNLTDMAPFVILQAIIQKHLSLVKDEYAEMILKIIALFPENRSISLHTLSSFLGANEGSEIVQKNIQSLVNLKLLNQNTDRTLSMHCLLRSEIMNFYKLTDKNTMRNFRKGMAQKLFDLYKEFSFLELQLYKRDLHSIIDDFNIAFVWSEGNKEIDKLRSALVKEKNHVYEFAHYSHFFIQQIYNSIRENNRTGDLLVNILENSLNNVEWKKGAYWLKRINRIQSDSSKLVTHRILKYAGNACSATFSKNGSRIIVATPNSVKTWDTATGKEVSTLLSKVTDANVVEMAPNGKYIIFCKYDTIGFWKQDDPLITTIKGHNDWILSLAFSPYSRLFSSGGRDGIIKMWSIEAGRLLRVFRGHKGAVTSLSFSPRNTEMISGGTDKNVILWSLETNNIRKLPGHFDTITAITYSPDGSTAISGAKDCLVKLWDTKSGKEIFTFAGHKKSITSVAFSPNGKLGLSASLDGTLRLWCLTRGCALQVFATDRSLLTGHFCGNEIWACNNSMIPIVYHFSLEHNS